MNITDRERQVLDFLKQGWSNKAIAIELGISHNTVKAHVRNLLMKHGIEPGERSTTRLLNKLGSGDAA